MQITRFQRWVLKWVFGRIFKQGLHHRENVVQVQCIMLNALVNEFTEDTDYALSELMRETARIACLRKNR